MSPSMLSSRSPSPACFYLQGRPIDPTLGTPLVVGNASRLVLLVYRHKIAAKPNKYETGRLKNPRLIGKAFTFVFPEPATAARAADFLGLIYRAKLETGLHLKYFHQQSISEGICTYPLQHAKTL